MTECIFFWPGTWSWLMQACMTNFACSEPGLFLIKCRTGPRIYVGQTLNFLGLNSGIFPSVVGHWIFSYGIGFSLSCLPYVWAQEMGSSLVLPSSPKLLPLGPLMGLVNARDHPYHNLLSKPYAFAWFGPT